jgi:SAM-dependent methyltransferase
MTTHDEREYVLGTNDEELARLGFQHRVWGEQAFALWERAGFAPGQTILDAGCGPGFATLDLARLACISHQWMDRDQVEGRGASATPLWPDGEMGIVTPELLTYCQHNR